MATITLPTAAGPVAVSTHQVSTRVAWSDAWTVQSAVHCQRITRSTGETLSAAEFRYRYGPYLAPGAAVWTTAPVLVLNPLSYVRVVVAGTGARAGFTWYGVWKAIQKNDVDQILSAVGLEQTLDQPCRDAPWWDGAAVQWSGVGLAFNADGRPNRSVDKQTINGQSVYVFEPNWIYAQHWSTRTAVETLLALGAPKDSSGTVLWNWTPVDLTQLPDFDRVSLDTHNVTFLALLRSLVTRFRLTGFVVEAPASGSNVDVRFFTFAETAIDLTDPSGDPLGTIPANAHQDTIVYSADQSSTSSFATEASNVADQVVAIGARRRTVFSLWKRDAAWAALWTPALQQEYDKGAENAADYPPAADVDLRAQRDADARNTERLRPVYSHFGPGTEWDQIVTRGDVTYTATTTTTGGEPQSDYPLGTDDDGNQVRLYAPLLRFAERLPLLSGFEYDGSKIADSVAEDHRGSIIAGVPHEALPPLVFVRVVRAAVDPDSLDRWQLLDQLGRNANLEQLDERTSRSWSGDVRSLRDYPGLEIRTQGAPQHVIAAGENAGTTRDLPGAVDWGHTTQDLIATVCVEDPRPVEVRYPADADLVAYGELIRVQRIEAPEYGLDYVIPDTVVGVDATTGALLQSDGGYVRDDRQQLGLMAQRAYQWARVPRYALRLATGWIDGALQVGHLVTAATDPAGSFPVLSVISEITVEFPIASSDTPPRPRLSLATAFGEFDPR